MTHHPSPTPAPSTPDPKSFDFAQSVTQQILTLSTGVTALTLTFFSQFAKHPSAGAKDVLISSWCVFAGSIFFGLLTLMSLTGVLAKPTGDGVYSGGTRLMSGLQILCFLGGLVLTLIAGAKVI